MRIQTLRDQALRAVLVSAAVLFTGVAQAAVLRYSFTATVDDVTAASGPYADITPGDIVSGHLDYDTDKASIIPSSGTRRWSPSGRSRA